MQVRQALTRTRTPALATTPLGRSNPLVVVSHDCLQQISCLLPFTNLDLVSMRFHRPEFARRLRSRSPSEFLSTSSISLPMSPAPVRPHDFHSKNLQLTPSCHTQWAVPSSPDSSSFYCEELPPSPPPTDGSSSPLSAPPRPRRFAVKRKAVDYDIEDAEVAPQPAILPWDGEKLRVLIVGAGFGEYSLGLLCKREFR